MKASLDTGPAGRNPSSKAVVGRSVLSSGIVRNENSSPGVEDPGSASAQTLSASSPKAQRHTTRKISNRLVGIAYWRKLLALYIDSPDSSYGPARTRQDWSSTRGDAPFLYQSPGTSRLTFQGDRPCLYANE